MNINLKVIDCSFNDGLSYPAPLRSLSALKVHGLKTAEAVISIAELPLSTQEKCLVYLGLRLRSSREY